MLEPILREYQTECGRVLEHAQSELAKIRTGRARPSLVEDMVVEAYGSHLKLRELASITAPEPNLLLVKVWDQNIIKDAEKALLRSDLGFSTEIQGDLIRLKLPDLTQERREQLARVLREELEQNRISIRTLRDKAREKIRKLNKESKVSEDERFRVLEDLDEETKKYILRIDTLGEGKEREIRGE